MNNNPEPVRGSGNVFRDFCRMDDMPESGKSVMTMKNPVHPGILVKECLDGLHLSVAEGAKGLGMTRQQLHNVIVGRSNVTPEMAVRLEKEFGSTADTWLRMQMNYDLAQVR